MISSKGQPIWTQPDVNIATSFIIFWEVDGNQAILTARQTNVFISYGQYLLLAKHLELLFSVQLVGENPYFTGYRERRRGDWSAFYH